MRSPSIRSSFGLLLTLLAVAWYSAYSLERIRSLQQLQNSTIDRNRKDSLQLLRIQNDLTQIGFALQDIAAGSSPYGIIAYRQELAGKRADLADAIETESRFSFRSGAGGAPGEASRQLRDAARQFWANVDRMFTLAGARKQAAAQQFALGTLIPEQASISSYVARSLFRNNSSEAEAAAQVRDIYESAERNLYLFAGAVMFAIGAISLGLILSNRRTHARLETLSQQRRILAGKLITMQEEILRSVSRELHDEFGQILTAVGIMLNRAEKKGLPPDSPFRVELTEVRQVTQEALEKMRTLSQSLHPSVLDDYGLVNGLDWFTERFQKQTGIAIALNVDGDVQKITGQAAIHCFRIVQEALTNAAKHGNAKSAALELRFEPDRLTVSIRDWGAGIVQDRKGLKPGLGLIAMRERAELMGGRIMIGRHLESGTLVTLEIPLPQEAGPAYLVQPAPAQTADLEPGREPQLTNEQLTNTEQ